MAVDQTEGGVAVPHRLGDDPDPDQVVDVLEGAVLLPHLAVDRVLVLGSPGHLGLDPRVGQDARDLADHLLDERLALRGALRELGGDLGVGAGVEDGEAAIFELVLDLLDPETMGQGGVNVEGLLGDPSLLLVSQRVHGSHVVETVEELDDQDPHVLGHRHHHLADRGRLSLLTIRVPHPIQLGHTVDETGHLFAELGRDLDQGETGVLHRVVE